VIAKKKKKNVNSFPFFLSSSSRTPQHGRLGCFGKNVFPIETPTFYTNLSFADSKAAAPTGTLNQVHSLSSR
jgi:hypothetical protein